MHVMSEEIKGIGGGGLSPSIHNNTKTPELYKNNKHEHYSISQKCKKQHTCHSDRNSTNLRIKYGCRYMDSSEYGIVTIK